VDTYCTDFHFVDADRKVQLDKDKHLFNRHDEKALARKVLTEVTDTVADLDMVILVAGMGGIIGTTVTPSIAAQMKELGVLTLALVVMPYAEQGARRQRVAETALQALRGKVDALLPVFNDQFDEYRFDWKSVYGYQLPMYLDSIYSSIVNPLCVPGSVNVEFADVRDITLNQIGLCAFGHGLSGGGNAAQQAAVNAIEHSSLGKSRLQQARSALFTLEHGRDVLQGDIKLAIQSIRSHLSPDCHFIYGISALESHREMVQVNILANGIKDADSRLV
jgi:cell division protein FtsZ